MNKDKFDKVFGGAMKNVASKQQIDKQNEDRRLAIEAANVNAQEIADKKKKAEEAKKTIIDKAVDLGKGIAGTAQRIAGTAAQGGVALTEIPLGLMAAAGDEKAKKAVARTDKIIHDIGNAKTVDGNSMSYITENDMAGKSSVGQFGAGFTKAGVDAAAFVQPELKGVGLLKGVASEVGINTATSGAASAADQYAKTGNVDLGQTVNDAVAGGVTAGVIRGARGVVGKVIKGKSAPATTPAAADAIKPVESTTDFSKISDAELQKQVDQFQGGERTANTQADYARYQQLQDEVKFRANQAEKTAFETNGMPNDVAGATDALKQFDSGKMPDAAFKPMPADKKSVAQIFADENIPKEIRTAAQEVMDDQGKVNNVLDTLMNDKKYEQSHISMDHAYNQRLREIEQMPEPRYVAEKQKLDDNYKNDLAEIEMIRAKDLPDVEKYNKMADLLDQREQKIVGDTNAMISNNPEVFKVADPKEVAAQRQPLVDNLDQAKRFNDPEKVVETVSQSSDPVKTFDRTPDAPEAYHKSINDSIDKMDNTDVVKANYKSLTDVQLAAARLTSPSQWLEHMGLRGEAIDLHTNILRAKEAENAANLADSKVLQGIADNLPTDKHSVGQIWDYLEGKRKTIDVGNEKVSASIKELLDAKRAQLKELGFETMDNYMPHIFDKKDPMVQSLFKGKVTGEITANNLKQRVMNSNEYSRDTMNVLSTYLTSINRKMNLEPALKLLDNVKTQVSLAKGEAELIDGYITNLKGYNTSMVGSAYNSFMDGVFKKSGLTNLVGQNHYSKTLSTQRMISAVATLGGNVASAIRNMTQVANTVADIGPRYATIGSVDGTRMLGTEAGRAELKRVGIMDGGVSRNYYDGMTSAGPRAKVTKTVESATKGLMGVMHLTDVLLRTQAYAGAKALAASKGLTGRAAEDFAARKVIDTQFITSIVDMPLAFSGQGMKSLVQLASFSGKQVGFLKRVGLKPIKDPATGEYRLDARQLGSLLSAVAVAAVGTEVLKPVIGMRETEWIPFYDQVAPMFGAVTGNPTAGGDSLYRSPLVRLMFGDGKSKTGLLQAIQTGDTGKFWDDNWSQIVPAGTQIKKSTEGFQTTTTGESRNDTGKLRYLQDTKPGDVLNASLFGQYTTESGRAWIDNGFPTLSDSQTKTVDGLASREAKQQYVDFYNATKNVPNRQDAYDEVKNKAALGNQNGAAEAARAYNAQVDQVMQDYFVKHDTLPQKLQDQLKSKIYINVGKISN